MGVSICAGGDREIKAIVILSLSKNNYGFDRLNMTPL